MFVVNGITSESISLIVISESSIIFNGMFDEILNDSLRWITETVLGLIFKYCDIPEKCKKPLKIICMANQEYELTNGKFTLFDNVSSKHQLFLNLAKEMNITYVKFSDLVREMNQRR